MLNKQQKPKCEGLNQDDSRVFPKQPNIQGNEADTDGKVLETCEIRMSRQRKGAWRDDSTKTKEGKTASRTGLVGR